MIRTITQPKSREEIQVCNTRAILCCIFVLTQQRIYPS